MNYEEKIEELTKRIEKLEKEENKRKSKAKIKTIYKITKLIVIIILLLLGYNYLNNKFIKPYKEKVDYVDGKINSIESYINDKWDNLQKYNPFSK